MSQSDAVTRRGMWMKLGVLFNSVVGLLLAVPIAGYLLSPVLRQRGAGNATWLSLGPLAQFPDGETRLATFRHPNASPSDGETANIPCWVRHVTGEKYQIFAINCAHLGCPVRWFPQSGLFMCPCHGGVYYSDGSRASGPPERGLFEYPYKVTQGNLTIQVGEMPTPGATAASLVNISAKKPPCA
jgi:menaquinol-cytochrome c reductase iron-sulfur subunit